LPEAMTYGIIVAVRNTASVRYMTSDRKKSLLRVETR
jgi:hypothetical protein